MLLLAEGIVIDEDSKMTYATPRNPNGLFITPIEASEIKLYINKLKPTTSQGSTVITTPIVPIFNLCKSTGTFPNILKETGGNTGYMNNYRPILLTSNLSKILEKCINKSAIS